MSNHILMTGLAIFSAFSLTAGRADAGHCCCSSGYSIGNFSTPTATVYSGSVYSGATVLRGTTQYYSSPGAGYYYSPSSYYYRSYSPNSYYQPYGGTGLNISIGSGYSRGYSYGPNYQPHYGYSRFGYGPSYGYPTRYGIGSRSGFSIGFGSSLGRHSHFHHH